MLRGQEQLGFDCGTVTSTVDSPAGVCATDVSKSIMLCCSSTAVNHNPVVCARHLCFYLSEPKRAAGTETKVSVIPHLLHERRVWRPCTAGQW